jgi:D-beta-D-heptose 7-phosphate kinase/D-beta-D-heptose 1-phosphate adenosyltransferase
MIERIDQVGKFSVYSDTVSNTRVGYKGGYTKELKEVLSLLKGGLIPKILVIGDAILDSYIVGDIDRINPEAPVPLMNVKDSYTRLGGAGNVVANLYALGAEVYFTGILGIDPEGESLFQMIKEKTKTAFVMWDKDKRTPVKTRLVSNNQQLFRYDDETTHESTASVKNISLNLIDLVEPHIVIFSDYGKGSLSEEAVQAIIDDCNKRKILTFVDPHVDNIFYYKNCHCLKLNLKQARKIGKRTMCKFDNYDDEKFMRMFTEITYSNFKIDDIIITRAEKGIYANCGGEIFTMDAIKPKDLVDATGAGDTIISAYTFALGKGLNHLQAMEVAMVSASIAISKVGAYQVSVKEIEEYFLDDPGYIYCPYDPAGDRFRKLRTKEEIGFATKNKKVVFVNGCFDVLHPGHVELLKFAKSKGEVLVVGLNSDSSIKRAKGEDRPIICEQDRAAVLAELECVDYVCIFNEDTPVSLIKELNPFLHVKGSDHTGECDIENTIFFNRVGGYSTTKLVERRSQLEKEGFPFATNEDLKSI